MMRVTILKFLHLYWLWEDFKAWRRGEKRVAPKGTKGRVYAKKADVSESSDGAEHKMFPNAVATLEIKVTRADGSVEMHNVPATIEKLDG